MKLYMAPMEGMTGYVFRNAYAKYYHDVDRYFTPFISSTGLSHRELHDVLPENNRGLDVVPQILTNKAEDFLAIAGRLREFGYEEVNLNLGCPSGTVVSKGRGAGFLRDTDALERFMDEIFEKCPLRISVKTRIGVQAEDEWEALLEVYNRFPLQELIVHPRIQKDFYKHPVRWDAFAQAVESSRAPLCYNGDIHSVSAFGQFRERFPDVERIMLGRGIFMDPGLAGACRNSDAEPADGRAEQDGRLREMMDELLQNYRREMGNDLHTLYKMKEIWTYLGQSAPENARLIKRITKARTLSEYKIAADEALRRMNAV